MAASAFTFKMEADYDRDGTYETDVTSDTSRANISRGMGKMGTYNVGQLDVELFNDDGTYTPEYTSSSLFGQLEPGVPVRLVVTHNSIDYTLFTGYSKRIKNSWASGNVARAGYTAQDLAAYLQGYSTTNVTVDERTTSEALSAIFTNIGLSGGDYNLATGQQTLDYHWTRNQNALEATSDAVDSELGGIWFVDAAGVIQFQSRNTRLGTTADDTWGDDSTNDAIYPFSVEYEVHDDDLISEVSVQSVVLVAEDATQVVFTALQDRNTTPLQLTAGEKYDVELDYPMPVTSLSTPVAGADYQFNTAADGSGTDITSDVNVTVTDLGAGFRLQLENTAASTAHMVKFQLQGLPLNPPQDRPVYKSAKSIPGEKIDQGLAFQVPFGQVDNDIYRQYSMGMLRTFRYPYPRLTQRYHTQKNNETAVAMLSVEIGDLISFKDRSIAIGRSSYVDDWWYVESVNHTRVQPGAAMETHVTLIPSYLYFRVDSVLFDDFSRSNAAGDLGDSLFGDTWANDSGFDINSEAARANTDTLSMATQDLGTGLTDQVVEASLASIGSGDEVGVVLRYTDANNQVRVYLDKGSNEVIAEKNVAGTVTYVNSESEASPAYTVGTSHEIKAMVQDTRLRVYVDRVLQIDTTDGSLPSGTNVGLMARNANATTTFDDWHGRALD